MIKNFSIVNERNITFLIIIVICILFFHLAKKYFKYENYDNVPGCYNSIRDDINEDINLNDYIIKTSIVTPVCPSFPIESYSNSYEDTNEDPNTNEGPNTNEDPNQENDSGYNMYSNNEEKNIDSIYGSNIQLSPNVKKNEPMIQYNQCPPCPACERCPEPIVDCKKVINYSNVGKEQIPVPMLADFSNFV